MPLSFKMVIKCTCIQIWPTVKSKLPNKLSLLGAEAKFKECEPSPETLVQAVKRLVNTLLVNFIKH